MKKLLYCLRRPALNDRPTCGTGWHCPTDDALLPRVPVYPGCRERKMTRPRACVPPRTRGMEAPLGLEPRTYCLTGSRSTN